MALTFESVLKNIHSAKAKIAELLALMQRAKDNEASLDGLNAQSAKAEYKLWQNIFAAVSYIVYKSVEERKKELDLFSSQRHGFSAAWLNKILRDYQHTDTLALHPDTGLPYYPTKDPDKQIIKRVAIVQRAGSYIAKVAGEDAQGNATPFDNAQLAAIKAYLDAYLLGNHGVPESKPADLLQAQYDIYYHAIKGENAVRAAVEQAVNAYLNTLKTLDFGGTFYLSKLEDAIQSVTDVEDFERKTISARRHNGTFYPVKRQYIPDAGYMDIDPDKPLSNTLNFIPV